VRAAAMSGDCDFLEEVSRGNWSFNYFEECVKRRALLATRMHAICADCKLGSTFKECLHDSTPFV
jgi:hypothetical protein